MLHGTAAVAAATGTLLLGAAAGLQQAAELLLAAPDLAPAETATLCIPDGVAAGGLGCRLLFSAAVPLCSLSLLLLLKLDAVFLATLLVAPGVGTCGVAAGLAAAGVDPEVRRCICSVVCSGAAGVDAAETGLAAHSPALVAGGCPCPPSLGRTGRYAAVCADWGLESSLGALLCPEPPSLMALLFGLLLLSTADCLLAPSALMLRALWVVPVSE